MEEEGTGLKHRDSVSGTTPGSPTREPAREAQIREQLEGNLCRCTGYQNIVQAVQQGAAAMKA